jgi:hypothetical protein
MNCGVFVSLYMKILSRDQDISDTAQLFKNKEYHQLFQDANPQTMMYARKALTVALIDGLGFGNL